jgi:hypothetical protein
MQLVLHQNKVMRDFIKKHLLLIIFSVAGALGGFLYWKFVGCLSGTCIIKSVWYWSTLYGSLLGYVSGGLVEEVVLKSKKKKI